MNNYLIFQGEDSEIDYPHLLKAMNEKNAIDKYLNKCLIPDNFVEHIHEWVVNDGLAEIFFYDHESDNRLPKKESEKKIRKYFIQNPEYAEIFLNHWYEERPDDLQYPCLMKKFPNEMIRFIWIKEMTRKKDAIGWTKLNILNLDLVPVLK